MDIVQCAVVVHLCSHTPHNNALLQMTAVILNAGYNSTMVYLSDNFNLADIKDYLRISNINYSASDFSNESTVIQLDIHTCTNKNKQQQKNLSSCNNS